MSGAAGRNGTRITAALRLACQPAPPKVVTLLASRGGGVVEDDIMRCTKYLTAICLLSLGGAVAADEVPDSAALDASFGNTGKFTLAAVGSQTLVATDIAPQTDGRIVFVGYFVSSTGSFHQWIAGRLNANGSTDSTFAGGTQGFGFLVYEGGANTRPTGVAIRPNGKILVTGTVSTPSDSLSTAAVLQLNADGSMDTTWGDAGVHAIATSAPSDDIYAGNAIVTGDGGVVFAGTYHQQSSNNNNFFFDRVAADGKSDQPFQFIFGGPNADAHAFGVAIDDQGRYLVSGYNRGGGGNYDCAVIRIDNDLYDVDRTFGHSDPDDYGYQTVAFDYGGDNFDSCNAVVLSGDYIVLGGNATAPTSGGTYQAAALALLDSNGALVTLPSLTYAKFAFAYGQSNAGAVNTIEKLIIDPYETKYPYLYAIGSSRIGGSPHGTTFGIARVELPQTATFIVDPKFAGGAPANEYFITRPDGIGLQQTTNQGNAAMFEKGKLVVAGSTGSAPGSAIAIARFAAFDGIFKNGCDVPYF
jgi:uncharacterized delta-60 repeat protein